MILTTFIKNKCGTAALGCDYTPYKINKGDFSSSSFIAPSAKRGTITLCYHIDQESQAPAWGY